MLDADALAELIADVVAGEVEKTTSHLLQRIADLEARKPEKGEPGRDATAPTLKAIWDDARPEAETIIKNAVAEAVAAIPKPENGKNAAGIVEALKDAGELVLTLEDGRLIRTGIRDGEKGQDGRDGFNLEDFDVEAIDERTIDLRFTKGEVTHAFELKFPVPVYRNVFKQGESYVRGDIVTWGGCAWHCEKDTTEKPEAGENWALMVKKGRDGKDAKNG